MRAKDPLTSYNRVHRLCYGPYTSGSGWRLNIWQTFIHTTGVKYFTVVLGPWTDINEMREQKELDIFCIIQPGSALSDLLA